jgi:hypothetical protein
MKTLVTFIGLLAVSLVIGGESFCTGQEGTRQVGPRLELSTNKHTFVLLEPIALTFKLAMTDQPLPGQSAANPRFGRLYALASSESGVEAIPGFSLNPDSSILTAAIEPGQPRELQLIFVPSEYKKLMRTGKYQIKAMLEVRPDIRAESVPLTIEIVEPGGLDLEASRYIRSKGLPAYFFEGRLIIHDGDDQRAVRAEAIKNLEEFVSLFGGSSYGDYATVVLSGFYFSQMEYALAISTLERLATKEEFARLDSVLSTLAAANAKLNNADKAREYLTALKLKCPTSTLIKSTAEFLQATLKDEPLYESSLRVYSITAYTFPSTVPEERCDLPSLSRVRLSLRLLSAAGRCRAHKS